MNRGFELMTLRTLRHLEACGVFLLLLSSLPAHAQNKTACELLSKADAEAVFGVTLQPPQPQAPFRSLLDRDFTKGTPDQGCRYSNYTYDYRFPDRPKPPKVVDFNLEVRYSPTPDPHAIDEARKQVDTRTYGHPTDLPNLGDAAFWVGRPDSATLFVFVGGTTRLLIGPGLIGLEEEKAVAAKALTALGKGTFSYGTEPTGLHKPVLDEMGPHPSAIDQLKHALTVKADALDTRAQLALGRLYQSGTLAPDGSAQHDYAGAAYWYHQASDRGDPQAAYELAILYRNGLGVPVDASQSFQLLRKAAEANYVPAMSPLSDAYAEQKTPTSGQRATYWATQAANAGDPRGWLVLGFEYNTGKLGGDRSFWYQQAMVSYRKAADGGNCLAMMAIGDLYATGSGVRTDQAEAQNWHARAESCQGGNTALLQQQVAQYKARAVAARDPALYPVLAALPDTPKLAASGRNADGSGFNQKIIDGLVAAAVIYIALNVLHPSTPSSDGNQYPDDRAILNGLQIARCAGQGKQADFSGGGCQ